MPSSPATPTYVLRGHNSAVPSLFFFHQNAFLASGDGDGWLIVWSIASKRPVAVWKAHDGGVTGIKAWKGNRLLTHGRDHKLRVWRVDATDWTNFSIKTPADGAAGDQPKPWLLHAMDISALNFCTFAVCDASTVNVTDAGTEEHDSDTASNDRGILIATPNALDTGGVDIFHLPSEKRMLQLHPQKEANTGMVMSLAMYPSVLADEMARLTLLAGYEDGRVMVHYYDHPATQISGGSWHLGMDCKAHSQPVLSLDLSPRGDFFVTSSADAVITKFMLQPLAGDSANSGDNSAFKTINTKHAGQQGLSVRSDGKIFATAGWDARARVYSCKTLKELAVLKWHKDGCSSTAFATVPEEECQTRQSEAKPTTVTVLTPSASTVLEKVKQERSLKAQRTHWLAVGGKDAKISLWDIY